MSFFSVVSTRTLPTFASVGALPTSPWVNPRRASSRIVSSARPDPVPPLKTLTCTCVDRIRWPFFTVFGEQDGDGVAVALSLPGNGAKSVLTPSTSPSARMETSTRRVTAVVRCRWATASALDRVHAGVQHLALLQGRTQRAVQAVLEVEIAVPLDDVREQVAEERRVLVEQRREL